METQIKRERDYYKEKCEDLDELVKSKDKRLISERRGFLLVILFNTIIMIYLAWLGGLL